jgi:CTP synthase
MEIIELQDDHHPYYVGVQFHPEYLSRVLDPSKPYLGFVAASGGCLEELISRIKGKQVLGMVNGVAHM